MKFNKETILDPAIVNIEGASMLLPEGWKLAGKTQWRQLSDCSLLVAHE